MGGPPINPMAPTQPPIPRTLGQPPASPPRSPSPLGQPSPESQFDRPLFQRPELWQAMMQTGLGMMAGSSTPGATFASTLGQSAAGLGVPTYQQGRERAAMSDAMRGVEGGMERLAGLSPQAALQLRQLKRSERPTLMSGPNGSIISIDDEGQPSVLIEGSDDNARARTDFELWKEANPEGTFQDFYTWKMGVTQSGPRTPFKFEDADGTLRYGIMDPDTGRIRPVQGGLPPATASSSGGNTEGARKARAFLTMVPQSIEFINEMEGGVERSEFWLQKIGAQELTDAEMQQLDLHGGIWAEAFLRMTTGAAYNAQEFANAQKLFTPQPGDKDETLQLKLLNRLNLVKMLEELGGVAGATMDETPEQTMQRILQYHSGTRGGS